MNETLWAIAAGLAPGIFWLWFFYTRDKIEREPLGQVMAVYFFGMLSIIPSLVVQIWFQTGTVLDLVVMAPVTEEPFKLLCLLILLKRKKGKLRRNFNEPLDGIIYGAATALGFATVENIFYTIKSLSEGNFGAVSVLRALFSVPGHALWGGIWGFSVAKAWFSEGSRGKKLAIISGGLILAMVCHGLFNFGASAGDRAGIGIIVGMSVIFWILVMRRVKKARGISPFLPANRPVQPTAAGAPVEGSAVSGAQWPAQSSHDTQGLTNKGKNDDINTGGGI